MSASKKKMQRREAVDVEKVSQAQAEQAAYKKKVRLYTIIGIVIAVLVAALLVWNSGIFQKNATAATIGEDKLSVAELGYYYYNNQYRNMYVNYYGISEDDVYNEEEGTTYRDLFLDMALQNAQQVHLMYKDALAHGYSDADVKDSLASELETVKSTATAQGANYKTFLKAYFGRYMTPSVFEKVVTKNLVASLYSNDLYNKNYDELTAEELEAYYNEHEDEVDSITYSTLYFKAETVSTTDETGKELSEDEIAALKETAMADAKARAEKALAFYEGGMAIDVLIEKTAPDSSVDHNTVVGTGSLSSVYSEELLALGTDKGAIVENEDYGYYLVFFHERGRDETLSANVRHILVSAETTTGEDGSVAAPTDEAWAAAEAKANEILAEYKAGAQTAEAFGALANKYSDDGGSNTTGGLYEGVRVTGSYVTEFLDWIFDENGRSVGDTGLVRHEGDTTSSSAYWGYHVMYLDSFGEAEWQLYVRDTLASQAVMDLQDSLYEAAPAELASGASYIG